MAKGDSAVSSHYWQKEDTKVISSVESIAGHSALLPNDDTIEVTSQHQLPLSPHLSNRANDDMILPGLKSASLISIGQLCDDNCDI